MYQERSKLPRQIQVALMSYANVSWRIYFDHVNKDAYYISEGDYIASTYVRKLNLEGEKVAKIRTFDSARVYYIYPDGQKMIIAIGTKYLIVNTKDLKLIQKFMKNVPSYPYEMDVYKQIICTTQFDVVRLFDMETETRKYIKIPSHQKFYINGDSKDIEFCVRQVTTQSHSWYEYFKNGNWNRPASTSDEKIRYDNKIEITLKHLSEMTEYPASFLKRVDHDPQITVQGDTLEITTINAEKFIYNFINGKLQAVKADHEKQN